jgi:hypothetical protein
MTVRIGEAVRSKQPWGRNEHSGWESLPGDEHVAARQSFSRPRLMWWFAPQPGRRPKS